MYLDMYSFNARVSHETLPSLSIEFAVDDGEIKDILKLIQDFNRNKDVVYSCMKCSALDIESHNEYPIYNDTVWNFAYKTREIRDEIIEILLRSGLYRQKNIYTNKEPTECPFRNNSELI